MNYSKNRKLKTVHLGMIDLILVAMICAVSITNQTYAETVTISDEPIIEEKFKGLPDIRVTLIPAPPVKAEESEPEPAHLSEEVPLPEELQEYIWKKCQAAGVKHTLFLALLQQESQFGTYGCGNRGRYAVISSFGDYGMSQINDGATWEEVKEGLGWDKDTPITVLFDPYKAVDAGVWRLGQCVARYGNTEAAYDAYNRGLEHHGSTKKSKKVVAYWNHWKEVLGDI